MSVYTAETSWDPIDRDISNRFFGINVDIKLGSDNSGDPVCFDE